MKANFAITIFISLILFFSGCTQKQQDKGTDTKEGDVNAILQGETTTITVGFIGPLTGEYAQPGNEAREAVELAVEEVNEKWKERNTKLKVIYEDGKCSPEPAANAANKLVNVDNVPVIFGGLCSPETLGAAPIAEGKTVLLAECSSSPKVTTAGDYIFRNYPVAALGGTFAAEYTYNDLGEKKAATMNCLADYCTGLQKAFKEKFVSLGGEILREESFDSSATDLKAQLTKIKDSGAEVVFMTSYTGAAVAALQQAKELGLEARFVGGDAWNDSALPKQAGKLAEGIMIVNPKTRKGTEFENKMVERIGRKPSICPYGAYDNVKIVAGIIERIGADPAKIKGELYKVRGYEGVSGTVGFDGNGDVLDAQYGLLTVKEGEIVEFG